MTPFLSRTNLLRYTILRTGNFLLVYISNFHVLNHLLLIYICKLHWNLNRLNATISAVLITAEGDEEDDAGSLDDAGSVMSMEEQIKVNPNLSQFHQKF